MIKNYLNKFSLKNKKAFVIGGSGLLGSEIIEALVSASANVINLDNNKKKSLILKKKFEAKKYKFVPIDVSDLKNLYKRLSILRKNIDMHLNSYSWLSFKFCEKMKKEKINGSVIMLSSIYGSVGQNPEIYKNTNIKENMNYSIIKGGINNFTKQLAAYYGPSGIRVNSICSGGIVGHIKGFKKRQNQKFKNNYSRNCPLKRLGRPDEIASSVLFLASSASSYITGTSFFVDGGWTAI